MFALSSSKQHSFPQNLPQSFFMHLKYFETKTEPIFKMFFDTYFVGKEIQFFIATVFFAFSDVPPFLKLSLKLLKNTLLPFP